MSDTLVDITTTVRSLFQRGDDSYRKQHIETEKAYRNILIADLASVLSNGKATEVKTETSTVKWQGRDRDGRVLELLITLYNQSEKDTLDVSQAVMFLVGTAYDPNEDDDSVRRQWLKENPDWEEDPRKTVKKRVMVFVKRKREVK